MTTLSQTGARLVHEGQLEGRKVQLPVFLARRPDEPVDADLKAFYDRLLRALRDDAFREGVGARRAPGMGWKRDVAATPRLGLAWRVVQARGREPRRAAGFGSRLLPWDDLRGRMWLLEDASDDERYERSGDDLRDGLYVALEPWQWHLFQT